MTFAFLDAAHAVASKSDSSSGSVRRHSDYLLEVQGPASLSFVIYSNPLVSILAPVALP